jgi:hypothetical protein
MIRPVSVLIASFACTVAVAQTASSVAGVWVPAPSKDPNVAAIKGVVITFRKDGTFSFTGPNTVGAGRFRVAKSKLTMELSKRNGQKPTTPNERDAVGTIVEGGKAILMSTGMKRNNVPVLIRLVRKK